MNEFIRLIAVLMCSASLLTACQDEDAKVPTAKSVQTQKAQAAANSINFDENAEIDNIKARLELTSKPGLLGYVVLLNEMGQPVMYTGVKGKITSGGKRLTDPRRIITRGNGNGGVNMAVTDSPSDEGTFGSSGEYVYFWTPAGQYIQWNGKFLYSDKPFRLTVQPLVVSVEK